MSDNDDNFEDASDGLNNPKVASKIDSILGIDIEKDDLDKVESLLMKSNSSKALSRKSNSTPPRVRVSPRKTKGINNRRKIFENEIEETPSTSPKPKPRTITKVIDDEDELVFLKAMSLFNSKKKKPVNTVKVVEELESTRAELVHDRKPIPTSVSKKVLLGPQSLAQSEIQNINVGETLKSKPLIYRSTHVPLSEPESTQIISPNPPKHLTPKSRTKPRIKVIDESLSEKERVAMLPRDPKTSKNCKRKGDLDLIVDVRPFESREYPDHPRQPPSPHSKKLETKVIEIDQEVQLVKKLNGTNNSITEGTVRRVHQKSKLEDDLLTFRVSSDDQSDSDSDQISSADDFDGNFKLYNSIKTENKLKRSPGHPRKIKYENEKIKRTPSKKGRQPKVKTEDEINCFEPFELPPKRKFKSTDKKPTGLITNVPDDDPEELGTNFMFLNNHESPRGKKRGKKTAVELANKERLMYSDAFSSPKKQRFGLLDLSATPSPSKRGIFSSRDLTPSKTPTGRGGSQRKISKREDQDRSARKRANRTLYSKLLEDGVGDSDNEDFNENVRVAEKIILESKREVSSTQTTPFATPRKIKPFDLPLHNPDFVASPLPAVEEDEQFMEGRYDDKALFLDGPDGFFDQHRHKVKPSNSSMSQAPKINYDEFNSLLMFSGFLHNTEREDLEKKYKELYTQWRFELEENFNLLFFGIGSKRKFLLSFVEDYLLDYMNVPVVVVNGYNPALKLNEILQHVLSALKLTRKIPKRQGEIIDFIVAYLKRRADGVKLILIMHNLDGESLRDKKIQEYIARLSSSEGIKLIASVDHINAPLLWDSVILSKYNFIWHNITSYNDYITEMSFRDPLALGRTQKSLGAKGAKYVLASLTASSRDLYRVLAERQLSHMEEDLETKKDAQMHSLKGSVKHALEFTKFFLLCAEEFISSNEINFRTMLTEFIEHKMAILTKDQAGTELIYIPFMMDEIQTLLRGILKKN